jgi:hypothetical protein
LRPTAAHGARRAAAAAVVSAAALAWPAAGSAQIVVPGDYWLFSYGPKTLHFDPSEEHVKWTHLFGAALVTERFTFWGADRTTAGLALFDNSFGQPSQYAYVGLEWDLWPLMGGQLVGTVTAGLLHGYEEEYQGKIPLNNLGIAPAIVPSIGWRYRRFVVAVNLLGAAGLIVTFSYSIPAPSP